MGVGSPELRPAETSPDITQLLIAWGGGDLRAMERLAPVLQQELHRVAVRAPGGRAARAYPANHRPGERDLPPADRLEERALAEPRPILRHGLADDAPHLGGLCPRATSRKAGRQCGARILVPSGRRSARKLGRSGGARRSLADTGIVRAAAGPHRGIAFFWRA